MKDITIPLTDYIDLLEVSLYAKKDARNLDSSWNYGIEELEEKISALKQQLEK